MPTSHGSSKKKKSYMDERNLGKGQRFSTFAGGGMVFQVN